MIPIKDANPNVLTPFVTYGLIVANIASWLIIQGGGFGSELEASICKYGLVTNSFLGVGGISSCASSVLPAIFTPLTSMFMHGGWMHLLGNMLFLWVFGDNVEDSMGHARFLTFYLVGGSAAAAAQMISEPTSGIPMVGASGAIGAVMGAYLILYPRVKVTIAVFIVILFTTFRVPAYLMLGYWVAVQLVSGIISNNAGGGVAFWAHFGGFAAGAILIHIFKDPELLTNDKQVGWQEARSESDIWNEPSNRQ